jgi:hypothetical protein
VDPPDDIRAPPDIVVGPSETGGHADQDGGAEGWYSGGMTTLAAPDPMRRSCQMLHPIMYVEISGSGMIFRKQILVSPRRWDP